MYEWCGEENDRKEEARMNVEMNVTGTTNVINLCGIDYDIIKAAEQTIQSTKKEGYHTYRECFYLCFAETQKEYMEKGKSPQTLADIESCNRIFVLADDLPYETIADLYVEELTPAIVKKLKKDIEQKNTVVLRDNKKNKGNPLSHKRLNNIYCWIDLVFKYAYDHGFVSHFFLEDIKLTKYGGESQPTNNVVRNFFSEKEFLEFDQAMDQNAFAYFSRGTLKTFDDLYKLDVDKFPIATFHCILYRTFFHLLFYTGLRKNELRGLRWCDFMGKDSTGLYSVKVDKQYSDKCTKFVDKKDHTRDPKTADSIRVCYLHISCNNTLCLLRTFLKARNLYDEENYIFFDFYCKTPKPIPSTNLERFFKRILDKTTIIEDSVEYAQSKRNINIHGLRHSACTMLIEKGMSLEKVAKYLGHKDTKMVERVYREYVSPVELSKEEIESNSKFFQ